MTLNSLKYLFVYFFLFEGLIKNQILANTSDSLINSQITVNQDSDLYQSYGSEYEKILNKADRAYRFGFYRRAKRYYDKAPL